MSIKISDLCFKYNKKAANLVLNNINLEINEGSINVILGLNGCGKSTLLKLLCGLELPLKGSIEYDGINLNNISIKDRSKLFSYVPQHSYILGDIPVYDYLLFGTTNTLSFYQKPGKKEIDKVIEIATGLGINHLLDKNIGHISGGERQIIFIAGALIQNTPIIFLDEPTSALDIKNQNKVLSILKEVANEGKTILLTSHNPNHALFLKAKVILMSTGELLMCGDSKELITINNLSNIYGDHICYSEELGYKEITFK